MVTFGDVVGVTDVVIGLDVAEGFIEQNAASGVITTVTISPFAREAFVYEAMFVPSSIPFNFH